ncbi:transcription factor grauzone-like [Temnothorax curvispinosus]|uniref:Transcription factor grauzone-like n=1 Tax=Temnothorax curvispinosus TaxID=300111 RepID=A0A6J1R3B6_9HYME|nr:transcription factor grauzone-like [Temnothorax curvispinosus]
MIECALCFRSVEGFDRIPRSSELSATAQKKIGYVPRTQNANVDAKCFCLHTCCECQKTYKSRMALNRHVREECGRILYTCPYCRNIMPMKFNLLNHLKKEHGC